MKAIGCTWPSLPEPALLRADGSEGRAARGASQCLSQSLTEPGASLLGSRAGRAAITQDGGLLLDVKARSLLLLSPQDPPAHPSPLLSY